MRSNFRLVTTGGLGCVEPVHGSKGLSLLRRDYGQSIQVSL